MRKKEEDLKLIKTKSALFNKCFLSACNKRCVWKKIANKICIIQEKKKKVRKGKIYLGKGKGKFEKG